MSDNVFYRDGDPECGHDDPEEIVDLFAGDGEHMWGDFPQPLVLEEWSSKPIRGMVRDDHVLDHLVERLLEFDLEEAGDDDGQLWDRMEKRAELPEVQSLFTAFLDLLFEGVGWRVADKMVARWNVTWAEPAVADDMDQFHYERIEITP